MPSPSQTSLARLTEFGVIPKRSLGQNFLIDDNILGVILERLQAEPADVLIEVGAGLGVLTRALAEVAAHVHAFEIDRSLEAPLRATLGEVGPDRVTLHLCDVLRSPLEDLSPLPTLCASNLPYSAAAPFLAESLVRLPSVRRYCVMVQREVAERLASPPGTKSIRWSVGVGAAARPRGRGASALAIDLLSPAQRGFQPGDVGAGGAGLVAPDPQSVRRVIDGAFSQRRKRLANALSASLGRDKAGVAGRPAGARPAAGRPCGGYSPPRPSCPRWPRDWITPDV